MCSQKFAIVSTRMGITRESAHGVTYDSTYKEEADAEYIRNGGHPKRVLADATLALKEGDVQMGPH